MIRDRLKDSGSSQRAESFVPNCF